jgi:hypothetical protein
VALALSLCACGGFSANKSVSPASFFLPGIGRTDTPASPEGVVATTAVPGALVAAH